MIYLQTSFVGCFGEYPPAEMESTIRSLLEVTVKGTLLQSSSLLGGVAMRGISLCSSLFGLVNPGYPTNAKWRSKGPVLCEVFCGWV